MCGCADRTIIMVTIIIVMMKGYYKNTGHQEKQCQTYKSFTPFFAQHVFFLNAGSFFIKGHFYHNYLKFTK